MLALTRMLLLTGVALLLQPAAHAANNCTGTQHISMFSDGRAQQVDLRMPSSHVSARRVPVIIALHPSGGNGSSFDRDIGLESAALARGFAVMFPNGGIRRTDGNGGADHFWNIPGVPLVDGSAVPAGARDDLQFIADLIDYVVKNHCADARRIYVTGFSGGARMTSLIGCRLAGRIAAIAPVAGLRAGRAVEPDFNAPDEADCRPAEPISVLAIHGADDLTNPYSGGGGVRWGYSVDQAVARWATLDECRSKSAPQALSRHISRLRYGNCDKGREVALYKINAPGDEGGGHVWPGGSGVPAEIDATKIVLDFFATH